MRHFGQTELEPVGTSHPSLMNDLDKIKGLVRPHAGAIVSLIGLIVLTAFLEGASFSLLVPLTQTLASAGKAPGGLVGSLQPYQKWLAGYPLEERLAILGLMLVALFGLKNGLQYIRAVLSTRLWLGIGAELRTKVLANTLQRPYRYFLDRKQGALVQQLYHEPHHVAYILQVGIEQGANLLTIGVLVALLVIVSWQVTALVAGIGSLYGLIIWWLSRRAHAGGEERQTVEMESMSLLTETMAGIRQIKVFSAEARVREVYETWVRRYRDVNSRYLVAGLLPQLATEWLWILILGILLSLPLFGVVGEPQSVLPVIAIFCAVAFRLGPYASKVSQGWLTLKFFRPALSIVGDLLAPVQADDRRSEGVPFQKLCDGIQFSEVTFSYGGEIPALSRVSLRFSRGEATAVVGPSGAGKSTLIDLLVRLYEPARGRILVDGRDLRDYERGSWLAAIGFISQDTFIFHGTIRDNIAFSKPDASPDEIREAAQQASAHEFIERCPQGYDTVVGDRGLKLSGGERQRIAIARALLRDPQVLIFDEATSALDNQSEALIQETIARIARDRTVILVAHRLSTVISADKIVVLDRGRMVEEGTHAGLLKEGGVYANLYAKGAV